MVIVAIFFLMLSGMYVVSLDMGERRTLLSSQMEGERMANSLALAIDTAARGGSSFSADIFVGAYPNQTVIVSQSSVVVIGTGNNTIAIAPLYSNLTNFANPPLAFKANQNIRINRTGDVIYVQPLG